MESRAVKRLLAGCHMTHQVAQKHQHRPHIVLRRDAKLHTADIIRYLHSETTFSVHILHSIAHFHRILPVKIFCRFLEICKRRGDHLHRLKEQKHNHHHHRKHHQLPLHLHPLLHPSHHPRQRLLHQCRQFLRLLFPRYQLLPFDTPWRWRTPKSNYLLLILPKRLLAPGQSSA